MALRVSCGVVVAVPVPVRVTVEVAPVFELLTTVSLPLTAPAVLGANVIGMASVCPGVRVLGRVVATMENPVPVSARELMVTAAVPEEVRVIDRALEVPSVMLP